jgi:hypothetical protein
MESVISNVSNGNLSEELYQGIPKKFLYFLNGMPFIKYEGLINLANEKGIKSLKTTIIQVPNMENGLVAIVQADLIGMDCSEYGDIGDASPKSVVDKIDPHILRMASTRAKARVLRDYLALGICCYEEIDLYQGKEKFPNDNKKNVVDDRRYKNDKSTDSKNLITNKGDSNNEKSKIIVHTINNDGTQASSSLNEIIEKNLSEEKEPVLTAQQKIEPKTEYCTEAKTNYLAVLVKNYAQEMKISTDEVIAKLSSKFKIVKYEKDPVRFRALTSDVNPIRDTLVQRTLFN